MESSNKIPKLLVKASILSAIIFWIQVLFEDYNTVIRIIPYVFLSIIPIFIICSFTVFFSILILYYSVRNKMSNPEIFKRFFPYYTIVIFGICSYFIIISNFQTFVCIFFITAFFTLMQTWIWLCKLEINKISEEKNVS
ncbi:hypothetical protein BW723_01780 [Polaribacter reichenbachii]|uniref:Uncharacterized protein n=1 Tax=Polaribacter reichenbachii TaxID=996801 RepID=A0A1B8TWK3_9FLAO|nr:hypothetical protein BW723_01780 [Polaribacter reichenbachii]AUC18964.1 hypothetical protein BTO17_09780 [Polaribacter reichenbachii]OBY63879.1 hypothetical protein LPB301_13920 [Polaribacter reichenbachii]